MRCFFTYICLSFFLFACKPVRVVLPDNHVITESVSHTAHPILSAWRGDSIVSRPLRLAELHLRVEVVGHVARTEMEMHFANDSDQLLEGELYFPLGEGQTVSGFALEVDGRLRDAVAVEKAQGRTVFESIVRDQVDPGLLEWTRGNTFRTRVYPILPHTSKRVQVTFEQELKASMYGPQYLLPMNFQDRVDKFSVDVKVIRQVVEPTLEENELMNFIFRKWEDAWIANSTYKNYLPNEQLGFSLPCAPFERQVFTNTAVGGATYFYLNFQPDQYLRERKKVRRICLLWDHSHSAAQRDTAREFALLDAYFRYLGNAEVELVPFSNAVGNPAVFSVRGGKWSALRRQLGALPNDGATQLGALDLSQYVCDEFFLASEGLSNLGDDLPVLPERPVHVLTSGPEIDFGLLRHIATATGGRFLHAGTTLVEEALELLSHVPYRFLSATCTVGKIEEMYPNSPQEIAGRFTLAGQLRTASAEVVLHFGFGNQVTSRETIRISRSKNQVATDLIPAIWAQKKLAHLDIHHEENREALIAHGKAFGLVSRYTSLLVLDRLEDYVRHRIPPPPELLDEYQQLVSAAETQEDQHREAHLERVVKGFAARKAWWEQQFAVPEGPWMPDRTEIADSLIEAETDEESFGSAVFGGAAEETFSEDQDNDGVVDFEIPEPIPAEEPAPPPGKDKAEAPTSGSMALKAWNPETPYLSSLREAQPVDRYIRYLEMKAEYGQMPAFYLDVSDLFREYNEPVLALRILSNIAELELENHELLRILAHRLQQLGYYREAISVFRKVLAIREEEPQAYRDLALALADAGEWQEAIERLYEVVTRPWDGRFPEIEILVAHEMNSLIVRSPVPPDLSQIDPRLIAAMPTDLRVVLNWDADNVDMDLWVTDPRGEKCFYSHSRTAIGGLMSADFTGGYGPEEFLLKKAMPGEYRIEVDYYGSSRQRIAGPVHIQAKLILYYGETRQEERAITLRLGEAKEVIEVGKFSFE